MMDDYYDLGPHSRTITTRSAEAQVWFNRGLNWCYAFHHEEALRCFEKVVEHDPDCAMGYWGIAYAVGPYYNIPWEKMSPTGLVAALARTHANAQQAIALSAKASAVEAALCHAFAARFQAPSVEDPAVLSQWDDAYADAMRAVYARFPDDNDVCALTAEALMVRTPWQLWDLENRTAAEGADTEEAIAVVEKALERVKATDDTPHPGLLHFYIHIMEMSHEPERALEASYQLETLLPDAGHLIHMPSHIYVLCGLYQRTIDANVKGVSADDKYLANYPGLGIFTIYRLHNLHFQVYGALFSGQYAPALRAAELMCATIQPDYLRVEHAFLANYLEAFYGMKAHVLIRFGMWQEILDEPLPDEPELYCVTTAFWQYAKGIAYAVLGDVANAERQTVALREALANIPHERIIFNNEARDIVAIAMAMLDGEMEYRRENFDVAFAHLRKAVHLYDTLNYSEPWSWMQPPRHALGALLLEQGQVEEAAAVYRADLGIDDTLVRPSQHPDNVWSLHGYAECCERLGDATSLEGARAALADATSIADVPIRASCACRKTAAA
jgi:tetratricopeptide (TPR) repeat protein